MIKTSIEKLAKDIGYDIGMSNDVTQADLLNGFCEALSNSMTEHNLNNQICYLTNKLTPKSHKIIKEIYGFIELKEKS